MDSNKSLQFSEWVLIILVCGVVGILCLVAWFEDARAMALLRVYLNKFMTSF